MATKPKTLNDVYRVLTWDCEKEKFTPQKGVRSRVHGLGGLRRALRALRNMSYEADRGDSSVLVEKLEPQPT